MASLFCLLADAATGDNTSTLVQSIVGTAVIVVTGIFITYIKGRDAKDERMHAACEGTIKQIAANHEEATKSHSRSFESTITRLETRLDDDRKNQKDTLTRIENTIVQELKVVSENLKHVK